MPWNFYGPRSAFNATNEPIPCYGKLGCTAFASAPQDIQALCMTAAIAPYSDATHQALAVRALQNNSCYARNGAALTPPAYGTIGNAGRNTFWGPAFKNVDMSIAKTWRAGERVRAEFRTEFFNLFNHPNFGPPSSVTPTAGITGGFGYALATPDAAGNNAVLGQGGPRHIQFGLRVSF